MYRASGSRLLVLTRRRWPYPAAGCDMFWNKKGRPGGPPPHRKPWVDSARGRARLRGRPGAVENYWMPRSVLAVAMYSSYFAARPALSSNFRSWASAFSETGLTFNTTALANSGAASLAFLPYQ